MSDSVRASVSGTRSTDVFHRAMALRLFEQPQATLVQAARLAGTTSEEFVVLLDAAGIPAVDYPPEELDDEVGVAS